MISRIHRIIMKFCFPPTLAQSINPRYESGHDQPSASQEDAAKDDGDGAGRSDHGATEERRYVKAPRLARKRRAEPGTTLAAVGPAGSAGRPGSGGSGWIGSDACGYCHTHGDAWTAPGGAISRCAWGAGPFLPVQRPPVPAPAPPPTHLGVVPLPPPRSMDGNMPWSSSHPRLAPTPAVTAPNMNPYVHRHPGGCAPAPSAAVGRGGLWANAHMQPTGAAWSHSRAPAAATFWQHLAVHQLRLAAAQPPPAPTPAPAPAGPAALLAALSAVGGGGNGGGRREAWWPAAASLQPTRLAPRRPCA